MKAGKDFIGTGLGVIIRNEKGEVFLMKRGQNAKNEKGSWMLPGGTLEFGETLQQGIIREILEEFDIQIKIDNQLPAHDHILPEEKQHWVTNVFIAHITHGVPKIMEPEKCEECGWYEINNLPTPIAIASQKALQYLIDNN